MNGAGGFSCSICVQTKFKMIIGVMYNTHFNQVTGGKSENFCFYKLKRERDTLVGCSWLCQQSAPNSNGQWLGSAPVKHRVCVQSHFNMIYRVSVTQLLLPFRAGEAPGIWLPNLNCLHDRVSNSKILRGFSSTFMPQSGCGLSKVDGLFPKVFESLQPFWGIWG